MSKVTPDKLDIPQLRLITSAWGVIKKLNINAKRVLVILLMDEIKSYPVEREYWDPRATKLVSWHEKQKALKLRK